MLKLNESNLNFEAVEKSGLVRQRTVILQIKMAKQAWSMMCPIISHPMLFLLLIVTCNHSNRPYNDSHDSDKIWTRDRGRAEPAKFIQQKYTKAANDASETYDQFFPLFTPHFHLLYYKARRQTHHIIRIIHSSEPFPSVNLGKYDITWHELQPYHNNVRLHNRSCCAPDLLVIHPQ